MKKIAGIVSLSLLSAISLMGLTLQESVNEVLNNNPIVQERLNNFEATKKDLDIAFSEYKPKIDISASAAYNDGGNLNNDVANSSYNSYDTAATLSQNIFNGFGTQNQVNYQESRVLSSAYSYLEKVDSVTYNLVETYLNVLRANELISIAKDNVAINKDIASKVRGLYDSGIKVKSDVNKINSSYALARSNYTARKHNLRFSKSKFEYVLGKKIDVSSLKTHTLNVLLPKTLNETVKHAIKNNPSIIVGNYNIDAAKSLHEKSKKYYYPTVDLKLSQYYNDVSETNSFDSEDDRFKAMMVMNYNLYNGGSDKLQEQKNKIAIKQEIQNRYELERKIKEDVDLAWSDYTIIKEQLVDLYVYFKDAQIALNLYQQEFELGRRTLLDLLAVQNDVIHARFQIVDAQYDELLSEYRLLNTMGIMVYAIEGRTSKYSSNVEVNEKDSLDILDNISRK